MKRFKPIIITLIVLLILSATMLACTDTTPKPAAEVAVTFLIGEKEYQVSTDKLFVAEALADLADSHSLLLVLETTSYGLFIKEIGELKPNSSTEFVAFYSSIDDLKYADPLFTKVIRGVTYYSCNYGIDTMPIIANNTYVFAISSF